MKKLLGILVIGLCGITGNKLATKEIKQGLSSSERRKTAPVVENNSGSWPLFTGLALHTRNKIDLFPFRL